MSTTSRLPWLRPRHWRDQEASPRVYERWTPWQQDEAGRWTRECPELGCREVLPLGVRPGEWYWGS